MTFTRSKIALLIADRDVAGKNIHEMRAIKIVFIFYFNFVYD